MSLKWNSPIGRRRISIALLIMGVLWTGGWLFTRHASDSLQTDLTVPQTDISFPFQYENLDVALQVPESNSLIANQAFAAYFPTESESLSPYAMQTTAVEFPVAGPQSDFAQDDFAQGDFAQGDFAQPNQDSQQLETATSEKPDVTPIGPADKLLALVDPSQDSNINLAPGINAGAQPADSETSDGTDLASNAPPELVVTNQEETMESRKEAVLDSLSQTNLTIPLAIPLEIPLTNDNEQTTGAGGTSSEFKAHNFEAHSFEAHTVVPSPAAGLFPPAVLPFQVSKDNHQGRAREEKETSPSDEQLALKHSQELPVDLPIADTEVNAIQSQSSTATTMVPGTLAMEAPLRPRYVVDEPESPQANSDTNSYPSQNASANPVVVAVPAPTSSELLDWWNFQLADPSRPNATVRIVSLGDLITSALEHSPRIRTIQRVPQISATRVDNAKSVFDPVVSLNNKYTDSMDPVGNTLTTGGAPFLQDNIWDSIGRVSKRLNGGSDLSFYQKLGFKNSNSNFFTPQDQGTATIGVDLRVPLRNGSGYEFNQAPVVIAELESSIAWDQYQTELQKEIVDLGMLYWSLQNARAIYLQQRRSVQRAEVILKKLEARVDYDASVSQVAQAKAELSLRTNELQTSIQSIVELEISIRERIGDPDLEFIPNVEVIPSQFASELFEQSTPELNQLMATAMENRFELKRDETKIQVADRQVFVSRSSLAPKLDMVFNVYQSSLQGGTGIERAFQQQFGNSPGFSGGLEYELPYGRRNAKATVAQAELQRMQAADLLQIQRNEIIADVQKAYTRWMSAKASYETAKRAVHDMRKSVEQLQLRWEEFAFIEGSVSQGATPSLALDQLLAGQRRLSDTEARLANAELNVAMSQQGILTATGTLLTSNSVSKDLSANDIAVPVETLEIPQGAHLIPLFNRQ